jgi:proteasome lid subunit RPN8/RPN11
MGVREDIAAHAAGAYPEECVGALLGDELGVREVVPLQNVARDRRRAFEVSARELLAVERRAEATGGRVWGFYHSHPDAAAEPSAADLAFASEGRWVVIVRVDDGRAGPPCAYALTAGVLQKVPDTF